MSLIWFYESYVDSESREAFPLTASMAIAASAALAMLTKLNDLSTSKWIAETRPNFWKTANRVSLEAPVVKPALHTKMCWGKKLKKPWLFFSSHTQGKTTCTLNWPFSLMDSLEKNHPELCQCLAKVGQPWRSHGKPCVQPWWSGRCCFLHLEETRFPFYESLICVILLISQVFRSLGSSCHPMIITGRNVPRKFN